MGTTEESFHFIGNVPEEIDKLNSLVTSAAILTAVAFNILPEILSGPLDLEMSIVCNSCRTSSSVHSNSSIVLGLTSDSIVSDGTSRGGNDLLKQSEKYEFNMVDLSLSVIASLLSSERVGIVDLYDLMYFTVFQNCFLLVVFTFLLKKLLFRIL